MNTETPNNRATKPIFKVGERIWYAHCGTREVETPCPVCFGKMAVVVILGNDEEIKTPCDYCGKGYEGPRGVVKEFNWQASPEERAIVRVSLEDQGEIKRASYHFAGGYYCEDVDAFATKEEAEARCQERIAEHDAHETQRREALKEQAHRSFSWHVGYHRNCIKEAKRTLAWHEARAIACAQRAKTPIPA